MSQHSRPFWGPPQGAWTRRKAAAHGNEAGSVKTAWVCAKGLWGNGPAQTKAARLGWREGAQATEEHTVNSLGWADRHGNRAGVADSLAWREGGKVGCRPGSGQVGDLHKVRDQAQSCSKEAGRAWTQTGVRTAWLGTRG